MRNIDSAEGGERRAWPLCFYEHSFTTRQMKRTIVEIVMILSAMTANLTALPVLQLPRACVFSLSFLRQFFRNSLRVYHRSVWPYGRGLRGRRGFSSGPGQRPADFGSLCGGQVRCRIWSARKGLSRVPDRLSSGIRWFLCRIWFCRGGMTWVRLVFVVIWWRWLQCVDYLRIFALDFYEIWLEVLSKADL